MNALTNTTLTLYGVDRVTIKEPEHGSTNVGEPYADQVIVLEMEDGSNMELVAVFSEAAVAELRRQAQSGTLKAA